ncbi:hypothetical protein [Thermomonospora umbrina]|uniref:hypothetical protein n=1 Tax=Thermomonospora umbrina TaxID=111806 RepID=UPI000E278D8B|nr:hypothetical protein [Thermomonospora umbrina]
MNDAYGPRLHGYAEALLGDRESAVEAVRAAVRGTRDKADEVPDATRLRAWLYALVRSECLDRLEAGEAPPLLPSPRHEEEPEAGRAGFRFELDALGELEREAAELVIDHGLGTAEVAEVLGVSPERAAELQGRVKITFSPPLTSRTREAQDRDEPADRPAPNVIKGPWARKDSDDLADAAEPDPVEVDERRAAVGENTRSDGRAGDDRYADDHGVVDRAAGARHADGGGAVGHEADDREAAGRGVADRAADGRYADGRGAVGRGADDHSADGRDADARAAGDHDHEGAARGAADQGADGRPAHDRAARRRAARGRGAGGREAADREGDRDAGDWEAVDRDADRRVAAVAAMPGAKRGSRIGAGEGLRKATGRVQERRRRGSKPPAAEPVLGRQETSGATLGRRGRRTEAGAALFAATGLVVFVILLVMSEPPEGDDPVRKPPLAAPGYNAVLPPADAGRPSSSPSARPSATKTPQSPRERSPEGRPSRPRQPEPPTPRRPRQETGPGRLAISDSDCQRVTAPVSRTCHVRLTAVGGYVRWAVSSVNSGIARVSARGSGLLSAGSSVTVTVTVRPTVPCYARGQGAGSVRFAPGGTASVTYTCW